MPRTRDLAIFVLTTTMTDGQTDCFIPCACMRGNKTLHHVYFVHYYDLYDTIILTSLMLTETIEKILTTVDDTTFGECVHIAKRMNYSYSSFWLLLFSGEEDWNEVIIACSPLAIKWRGLSGYLGIAMRTIRMIKENNPSDSVSSMNEALEQWILQKYDIKKHGLPSWKTLLKAVSLLDRSLFERLAKEHQLEGICYS